MENIIVFITGFYISINFKINLIILDSRYSDFINISIFRYCKACPSSRKYKLYYCIS